MVITYHSKLFTHIIPSISLMLLIACGGGGGGENPQPVNAAPTVSVQAVSANEGEQITLSADASDTDGTIASYAWSQTSGIDVSLSNAETSSVSFTAPEVSVDSEIGMSIVVTDNEGATATAAVTVTITNTNAVLIVKGLVVNGSNANVVFNVNGQEFATTTDTTGNYEVELDVGLDSLEAIVEATATGVAAQSKIKLRSILGSYDRLLSMAGSDGILTKDEMFSVNITPVSTAISALLIDTNNNETITTVAVLIDATKGLNDKMILPLAASIQLVIDFAADIPELDLPSGIADTLELVENLDDGKDYYYRAANNFDVQFEQVKAQLTANSDVFSVGVDESLIPIADTYYFESDFLGNAYGRLVLKSDGSGVLTTTHSETEVIWNRTSDGISITYPTGINVDGTGITYMNGFPGPRVFETISTGRVISWANQTVESDQLLIKNTTYRHFPNGEAPDDEQQAAFEVYNATKTAGVVNAADILQMNVVYSMPVPYVSEDIVDSITEGNINGIPEYLRWVVKMVFAGNTTTGGNVTVTRKAVTGNGSMNNVEQVMGWTIDTDGRLLINGGEQQYNYVFLRHDQGKTLSVNVIVDDSLSTKASSNLALLKDAPIWSNESAVGIYTLNYDIQSYSSYFWVEVNPDGTSLQISGSDSNRDGTLTTGEFSTTPSRWQINTNGNLVIRRYIYNYEYNQSYDFCTPLEFDPSDDAECVLWHEREWDLHSISPSNKYHMTHYHRFFDDPGRIQRNDPNVSGHILGQAYSDIRYWTKVAQRPVEVPIQQLQKSTNSEKNISNLSSERFH